MLDKIFDGIFDASATIAMTDFLLCVTAALILGFMTAAAYGFRNVSSKSFSMTLAILPAVVTVVIMMVNGNIGAGVAVAGAFSLVRFRSAQGSAREITAIFMAMATGLITGMGYIGYAAVFTLIMCAVFMIYTASGFGEDKAGDQKVLRITIPEDLDYAGVFDELLEKYTSKAVLTSVKTANMGSMFKLKYDIRLKDAADEKAFIDGIRERNGNLEVSVSVMENDPSAGL